MSSKTKSPVVCVCLVGGGSNMGLVVGDDGWRRKNCFCCCFLAAFTLADSTA